MTIKGYILSGLGILFGVLALVWIIEGNNFFLYKAFAPGMANAEYETFKQSQPYRDGLIKDLRHQQSEYVQADEAHKNALGGLILSSVGDGDEERLPEDLKLFIKQLRLQQAGVAR